MYLDLDIGNSETQEWEHTKRIELEDYKNVFKVLYPNTPYPDSITPCLALHKRKVELRNYDTIYISANFTPSTDSYVIAVFDCNEKNICQVIGKADIEGGGLSLIFTAPDRDYPVNVTIRS